MKSLVSAVVAAAALSASFGAFAQSTVTRALRNELVQLESAGYKPSQSACITRPTSRPRKPACKVPTTAATVRNRPRPSRVAHRPSRRKTRATRSTSATKQACRRAFARGPHPPRFPSCDGLVAFATREPASGHHRPPPDATRPAASSVPLPAPLPLPTSS